MRNYGVIFKPVIKLSGTAQTFHVVKVTPKSIDERISDLIDFEKAHVDYDEFVKIVTHSKNANETVKKLCKHYGLSDRQTVFFIRSIPYELRNYCDKDKLVKEIDSLNALKKLLINVGL